MEDYFSEDDKITTVFSKFSESVGRIVTPNLSKKKSKEVQYYYQFLCHYMHLHVNYKKLVISAVISDKRRPHIGGEILHKASHQVPLLTGRGRPRVFPGKTTVQQSLHHRPFCHGADIRRGQDGGAHKHFHAQLLNLQGKDQPLIVDFEYVCQNVVRYAV